MDNMFATAARASSPVPSEPGAGSAGSGRASVFSGSVGEGGVRASDGRGQGAGGANVRREAAGVVLRGRGPAEPDKRKFRYDVLRGRAARLKILATREDRMSAEEAGDMMDVLHAMFGVAGENEDVLAAFDDSLFFCHTVNSASTLLDGRSKFGVAGVTQEFSYGIVRDKLGLSLRRFFRAYADETARANKQVIADYDPYDPVSVEQYGWLMEVAHDRGLHRYPYLAHDSAEACTNLSPSERAALAASKLLVIPTTLNTADRMKNNSRVQSADNYDSTAHERL